MRFLLRFLETRKYGNCAVKRTIQYTHCKERSFNEQTTNRRSLKSSASRQNVFKSPRPAVKLPVVSLSDYMFSRFSEFGDKNALVDDVTGTTYTYSQLEDLSRNVGSFLYRKGFRKHGVICYYSTNNPELCLLLLGCASVGVILTTVNPAYSPGELKRHMEHSGAKTLVTVPHLVPKAKEADIRDIIVIGNAEGCQPFSDMLVDDGQCFPRDIVIDPHEDTVVMPYSSGTTGLPKGVMLSHYNVVSNLVQCRQASISTKDDINIAAVPLCDAYGMVVMLCDILQIGGKLITVPGFDPKRYVKAILEHKVTQLHVVPSLLLFLTRHPIADKLDFSHIRQLFCGGAPLGDTITQEFMSKRNAIVRQDYGLTETSPVVCVDYQTPTAGTVGPLVANTEVKFIDPETGKSLGRNETGEIWVKGPQIMKGYINNEKATKEMIDEEGWLRTGDIGRIEDNDFIVISDRLKELIKYKGRQVAPAELEDLLHKHPAVEDVAVIGMPDDRAGELPRAYVMLKPGVSLHAHDLMKYVEQNVSDYKRLRGGVEFVKEIPKTPSGKVLRRLLKDQL